MDISTYGDVSFFSSTKKTKIPTGDVSSSPHKKIKTPLCDSFQSPGATNAAQNYGGVDVFGSSFLMTRTGTKQSIQDQLDNGEDPNYQNNRGDSALHIVARELDDFHFYNCIERISLLIKHV